ncbi:hypothetical protein L0Z42_06550 [Burkholderia multivorans]|uniref:hypothetical protein n=1 Tax=Burkholderia multivorans TaxID=87883 RepID=UPI0020187365|nr:hypothetical protein [Burkholderia multivorans]MCO1370233.1 hypothetical protein [Burkholderia multivorans]MCO1459532.1 hypothetical protein [Burkholderia multivorans]MCO1467503.1 hypothetical protein [Burkholderia multivorans]MDN7451328.1 hypothetical protein [Burkholderia multivorans]UQO20715.1 hypothetical protein L0Z02_27555 [Burkholderia multivorans]
MQWHDMPPPFNNMDYQPVFGRSAIPAIHPFSNVPQPFGCGQSVPVRRHKSGQTLLVRLLQAWRVDPVHQSRRARFARGNQMWPYSSGKPMRSWKSAGMLAAALVAVLIGLELMSRYGGDSQKSVGVPPLTTPTVAAVPGVPVVPVEPAQAHAKSAVVNDFASAAGIEPSRGDTGAPSVMVGAPSAQKTSHPMRVQKRPRSHARPPVVSKRDHEPQAANVERLVTTDSALQDREVGTTAIVEYARNAPPLQLQHHVRLTDAFGGQ